MAFVMGATTLPVCSGEVTSFRYTIVESMGYPYNQFDEAGHLQGGLLYDLGQSIGKELKLKVVNVPLSRRRIEPDLLSGQSDINCYLSPIWTEAREQLLWSDPILPQIERVVGRAREPFNEDIDKDFSGKSVSTQLGYHYPRIDNLIERGEVKRLDENSVPMMFKALLLKHSDRLITSEAEIAAYVKDHPEGRDKIHVGKAIFSNTPTYCALSPKSQLSLGQLNSAIARLKDNGTIKRLALRYKVSY